MRRKILTFLGVVMTVVVGLAWMAPQEVSAADGEKKKADSENCDAPAFLGFKPWYAGLCEGNEIKAPDKDDTDAIPVFVWTIVLNVLFDALLAVGYLSLIFVIYGGYLYMASEGNPSKVERGKSTLTAAVLGTVIAMSASVIVNTAKIILGINAADGWAQADFTKTQMNNIFSWAYTIAGLVAVVFIIKGGFNYLTSQGDPGKTKTAMQTIIYAVVGLVVVILAALITNFIITSTGGALTS